MKMKVRTIILSATIALAPSGAQAGDINLLGNLSVNSNLTAQSITLGGVTQTNWPTGFRSGVTLTNAILDTSLSQFYAITLTNHSALDFQGHSMGRVFWLKIAEDSTGGWTNSWDVDVLWSSGVSPQPGPLANAWGLFQFVDDGTKWLGIVDGQAYCTNCGYALQYDGSQNYVTVANAPALYPTNAITVEFWFKTTGAANGIALSARTDGTDYIGYDCLVTSDGNIRWLQGSGSSWSDLTSTGLNLNNGGWHHYAAVWDGANTRLYADGTLAASGTIGSLAVDYSDIWIGNGSSAYLGTVDEVRISNTARYSSTFAPTTSFVVDGSTVAYWKFNEGGGSTAHDETSNHNSTLTGDPIPAWVAGR